MCVVTLYALSLTHSFVSCVSFHSQLSMVMNQTQPLDNILFSPPTYFFFHHFVTEKAHVLLLFVALSLHLAPSLGSVLFLSLNSSLLQSLFVISQTFQSFPSLLIQS